MDENLTFVQQLQQRGPTVSCICWVECCQQLKGDVSLIYRLLNVLGIFEAKKICSISYPCVKSFPVTIIL